MLLGHFARRPRPSAGEMASGAGLAALYGAGGRLGERKQHAYLACRGIVAADLGARPLREGHRYVASWLSMMRA